MDQPLPPRPAALFGLVRKLMPSGFRELFSRVWIAHPHHYELPCAAGWPLDFVRQLKWVGRRFRRGSGRNPLPSMINRIGEVRCESPEFAASVAPTFRKPPKVGRRGRGDANNKSFAEEGVLVKYVVLQKNLATLAAFLALVVMPGRSLGQKAFPERVFAQNGFGQKTLAQNATPAEAQKGVQILLLGTQGGPRLNKQRSEPATLLMVDGRAYLIDCGIGTMRRMLEAGVQSQTIGTIFITHNHPDHALGLVDVLANDFFFVYFGAPGTPQEFNIYGPPETPALVSAAYDYIRIPYGVFAAEPLGASTLVNPFKAHVIDHDGLVYQDDKIRVTAAENSHYQLIPAKYRASMKSYSYRFETAYGAIVFTGDTGPSAAVETLAKGADVLISEVEDLEATGNGGRRPVTKPGGGDVLAEHMLREHLPFKAVGELASKAQVKALILYHFVGGDDVEQFAAGVREHYSGPVFAGKDLARYCLGADGVKGELGLRACK